MHVTSPNTNFLIQGDAALDPCQGLAPGPHQGSYRRAWTLLMGSCASHLCFSLQAIPKSWKPWFKVNMGEKKLISNTDIEMYLTLLDNILVT